MPARGSGRSTARAACGCRTCCRTRRHVDDMCFIKSMHCNSSNHAPATYQMNTGVISPASQHGLVDHLRPGDREPEPARASCCCSRSVALGGARQLEQRLPAGRVSGDAFRHARHAGARPAPPAGNGRRPALRRSTASSSSTRRTAPRAPGVLDLDGRIAAYELALPHAGRGARVGDLSRRIGRRRSRCTGSTAARQEPAKFGRTCLVARRLVEKGVRVRAALSRRRQARLGQPRQHHREPPRERAGKPISRSPALLTDLKQRGLLDETLVIWAGEFGRTPMLQGKHRPQPQPVRLHRLAGRRRRERRPGRSAHRRDRPAGVDRPARRRATCTPRSSPRWGCAPTTSTSSTTAAPSGSPASPAPRKSIPGVLG